MQQSTGKVVASSTDVQSGRQDPSEAIDYVNTGAADRFLIVVQNVRGAAQPKNLNLYSFQPECAAAGPALLAPSRHERHNYNTASRSVSAQGDAGGSPVSVDRGRRDLLRLGVRGGRVSQRPTSRASTRRTRRPSSSAAAVRRSMAASSRISPRSTAWSVSGAGSFPTAVLRHVGRGAARRRHRGAAAAERALPAEPDRVDGRRGRRARHRPRSPGGEGLPLRQLPTIRWATAAPMPSTAVQSTLPGWAGAASLTFDSNTTFGASLTAEQLGFVDPDGCGLKSLTWTGGCGTGPGATMTCAAGTNAVTVAASNNSFGYSGTVDLKSRSRISRLGASPAAATVAAGQSSRHLVTIVPQSGAYNSAVT